MPKLTLMDELHVTILAPPGVGKAEGAAICRALRGGAFQRSLRGAVQGVFQRYPSLRKARFRIDR